MPKVPLPPAVLRSFRSQIKTSKQFKDAARKASLEVFSSVEKDFFQEFENHPITREIEGGADAVNLSGTLGGYGNLFSFIGFNSSSSPISHLRSVLKSMMRLSKIKVRRGVNAQVSFDISIPEMKVIMAATPMPWENGRSWVRGVERGISGFGYYMSTKNRRYSRSGSAIQTDSRLRPGAYVPTKYMSQMLRNLNKNLRRLVR